jgi:hypothetical protein
VHTLNQKRLRAVSLTQSEPQPLFLAYGSSRNPRHQERCRTILMDRSWNHRRRSAAIMTVAIQLRLASILVKGNDRSPESFRREMFCSTRAWAPIAPNDNC